MGDRVARDPKLWNTIDGFLPSGDPRLTRQRARTGVSGDATPTGYVDKSDILHTAAAPAPAHPWGARGRRPDHRLASQSIRLRVPPGMPLMTPVVAARLIQSCTMAEE
ncbi:hypothetical protein Sru01_02680 [Sphaerisporangium rufum]|uniref:Uncharacterized protein n=1 Tax=Sphaerisporangium rufum TaxID=1381558 RepID=A0A919QYU7_9ACTN|nr:hypothetical protein Sru01_02680 [Sphaerisporangium rufum]